MSRARPAGYILRLRLWVQCCGPGRPTRPTCLHVRVEPSGSTLKGLLNIFDDSFLEFQIGYQSPSEVRIGIILKSKDDVSQTLYFEDWGGVHNIHGLTEPTRILTSPILQTNSAPS